MARSRFGLLTLAAVLALSACGARGGHAPRPFPGTRPADTTDAARRRRPVKPSAVIETALSLQGVPYAWGGAKPQGFDCSGFTRYVYALHGIRLPRIAAEQYRIGDVVASRDLLPGDLVFFSTIAPGPSHVGLALGDGRFIHAPSERGDVRVENLNARYWQRRYLGARRIASWR